MAICVRKFFHRKNLGNIQFENSLEQRDFIEWLWLNLENFRTPRVPSQTERFDKRTGQTTYSLRFFSRSCFKPLYPFFYPKGKKIIPPSLTPFFDATALAVLYMGDGQLDKDGKCYIAAGHSWTQQDLFILQNILQTRFGLETHLHKNGFNQQGQ